MHTNCTIELYIFLCDRSFFGLEIAGIRDTSLMMDMTVIYLSETDTFRVNSNPRVNIMVLDWVTTFLLQYVDEFKYT